MSLDVHILICALCIQGLRQTDALSDTLMRVNCDHPSINIELLVLHSLIGAE